MPEKSRRPERDLYHTDYLLWINRVENWLEGELGKPDYPSHLAPDLPPLIAAFASALSIWDALNELQATRGEVFTNAATNLRKQLILVKTALPTVLEDPPVLGEFGLDRVIPRDRDDLFVMAQTCVNHWNELCDPDPPPEYGPMISDFTVLAGYFSDLQATMENYYNTHNAAQQAQNDMIEAREACHELERKIFNWYNARYQDSTAEWWTGTQWGASGGGSGGGGETTWPAKPTAEIKKITFPKIGIIAGCAEYTGTDRFDIRIAYVPKGEGVPPIPDYDYVTDVEEPVFLDVELLIGYVYYMWIRARKDGDVSEWSDVASLEWNG